MKTLIEKFNTAQLWGQSIPYIMQFRILNTISSISGFPLRNPEHFKKYAPKLLKDLNDAFSDDSRDLASGIYPRDLRENFDFKKQITGFKDILMDYPKVIKRKKENNTKVDSEYPEYFSRTFHFQTDGYTSLDSARLYDQQVEILFTGSANVMRRLLVKELSNIILPNSKILEQACGTGTSSFMMAKAFKSSTFDSTDLSQEYIEFAQENNKFKNINFLKSDATNMVEVQDESYDVVFSVFLHHELPTKERELAIDSMIKKLKPGGYGAILDSVQLCDTPQFEEVLLEFPKRYHEPFYTSYIKNPIEDILHNKDVKVINSTRRFLSKCVVFKK